METGIRHTWFHAAPGHQHICTLFTLSLACLPLKISNDLIFSPAPPDHIPLFLLLSLSGPAGTSLQPSSGTLSSCCHTLDLRSQEVARVHRCCWCGGAQVKPLQNTQSISNISAHIKSIQSAIKLFVKPLLIWSHTGQPNIEIVPEILGLQITVPWMWPRFPAPRMCQPLSNQTQILSNPLTTASRKQARCGRGTFAWEIPQIWAC